MSKRKLGTSAENNQLSNKIARITSEVSEESSTAAWLQHINDDIAYIIVDFLKLSATSLSALSLTCSRWHNQIDAILNKDAQHYLPVSYKKCTRKQRNEAIERFTLLCSEASVDLQLFEFQEKPTNSYVRELKVYGVPWAPHIVFIKSFGGFAIVDLNKGQVIVPFDPDAVVNAGDGLYPLCAINEIRKQVVIATTFKAADHRPVDDENDPDDHSDEYEWLYVYNVSNDGTVEFVTKFCAKNDYAVVHCRNFHAPPNLYLDMANELKRFSIDENKKIHSFDLNGLSVMGMGELDNKVMLFCADYESSPISVFDTSLNKFVGDLPESESVTSDYRDQEIEMKVVVRNNLVLVTSHINDNGIDAIYSVKPFKQIYHNKLDYDDNAVSPTGNKVVEELNENRMEVLVREGDEFNLSQAFTLEDSKVGYRSHFWWVNDDKLIKCHDTKFQILDKSSKYYDLPFKKHATDSRNVAVVGNIVLIADLVGKKPRSLSIYRMKI